MKTIGLAIALSFAASSAYAASYTVEAGNKKLAGAVKSSFLTKCDNDAKESCDKEAATKKLAGSGRANRRIYR
jgi:hypothetical protein